VQCNICPRPPVPRIYAINVLCNACSLFSVHGVDGADGGPSRFLHPPPLPGRGGLLCPGADTGPGSGVAASGRTPRRPRVPRRRGQAPTVPRAPRSLCAKVAAGLTHATSDRLCGGYLILFDLFVDSGRTQTDLHPLERTPGPARTFRPRPQVTEDAQRWCLDAVALPNSRGGGQAQSPHGIRMILILLC